MEFGLRFYNMDGEPIDLLEYVRLMETPEATRVGWDVVGEINVSTVLLCIDHAFTGGPPLIFETMVFGESSPMDQYMRRYATLADAQEGHAETVALVALEQEVADQ
jgi:hypothetical protein